MIWAVFIFVVSFFVSTLLGWIVHWAFHQPWSLWFYNAHMNHHKIQYPPTNFLSEKYKNAGGDSTTILFLIVCFPIIFAIAAMMFFGIFTITTGISILFSLFICGIIHNYFHDQFHLTNSWWNNFNIFIRWRALHYVHHLDMSYNYGIIFYQWDKLFGSYDDAHF